MKKFSFFMAAALALNAHAASKLDTQVITATGFKNSLADVADNMYVLDRAAISERGYTSVNEALQKVPGISLSQNIFGTTIDMRAQGSDKATQRVMLLVDGVLQNPADSSHMAHPANMININDIEQIEIIPGGGAVVYGGGAVGGVINIITKSSKAQDFANISLKYGSFDHFSGSAAAGVMIDNQVFLNFSAFAQNENGYQKADKQKLAGMSAGLKVFIADNHSLALNTRYSEQKARESGMLSEEDMSQDRRAAGFVTRGRNPQPYPAEGEELKKTTQFDVSANYSYAGDDVSINLLPYYSANNFNEGQFKNNRHGVKLRGKFTTGALSSHLGYDYGVQNGQRNDSGTTGDVNKKTHAIFALESFKFSDAFELAAGGRYEHSAYEIDRFSPQMSFPMPNGTMMNIPSSRIHDESRKENNFAASIVASANIDEMNKIYAKFERGFNSPGPYQLTDKVAGQYVLNDLKTEKFNNFEIGYKGLIAEQFISFAAYLTDTKDETAYKMARGGWSFENIGKTRRMGAELSLEQSFLDDKLSFYENLSYVHTKVKNDPLKPHHEGQKIPNVSPFSAAVGASYAFDSGLKLGADYRFYSKTHWNFAGERDAQLDKKSYGVLDLNAMYKFASGISVGAYAKNVLGEKYNLAADASEQAYTPAAKQSFYVELKYEY